ncbi:MAG TPA: hypothetical protein VLG92_01825 [Candidatus Saccharimonadia bacterium]|nr:hypothetical protein [Candidatus Saccharimonadia bacterium]
MSKQWQNAIPWSLALVVSILAVYAWGQSLAWNFRALNMYAFFPVLGLLAFSIMWSQYALSALKRISWMQAIKLDVYFRYTGYIVLAAIVLHPGLLVYQLFRDGRGLPPSSYEHFVAPGLGWVTLLGTASLLAFLAFELRRWFSAARWWKYIPVAGDMAMVAILYHSLRLGAQLQSGWFRFVWWFYGITLIAILAQKYARLTTTALRASQQQANKERHN